MKMNVFQVLVAAGLLAAARSALPVEPAAVTVHLSDGGLAGMLLTLAPSSVPSGPVEFRITNESRTLKYEFLILPWPNESAALPVGQDSVQINTATAFAA